MFKDTSSREISVWVGTEIRVEHHGLWTFTATHDGRRRVRDGYGCRVRSGQSWFKEIDRPMGFTSYRRLRKCDGEIRFKKLMMMMMIAGEGTRADVGRNVTFGPGNGCRAISVPSAARARVHNGNVIYVRVSRRCPGRRAIAGKSLRSQTLPPLVLFCSAGPQNPCKNPIARHTHTGTVGARARVTIILRR